MEILIAKIQVLSYRVLGPLGVAWVWRNAKLSDVQVCKVELQLLWIFLVFFGRGGGEDNMTLYSYNPNITRIKNVSHSLNS